MTGLKKLQFSLLALFISTSFTSTALAAVQDQRTSQKGGIYLEIEPFYARAADTFLTSHPFAISDVDTTPPLGGTNVSRDELHYFDPTFEWGGRLAIGYDYPCSNYGLSLEYTYFQTIDHQRIGPFFDVVGGGALFPALFPFEGFFENLAFTNVDAQLKSRNHTWDLLAHKNATLCGCFNLQVFAGARYFRLTEEYDAHYFIDPTFVEELDSDITTVGDLRVNLRNRFDGVGPRVGVNGYYPLSGNIGLTMQLAGNIVLGSSESFYNEKQSNTSLITELDLTRDSFESNSHNKSHVVPGWSGKVGLAYRTVFCNCSSMVIEAGYRGDKYYGVSEVGTYLYGDSQDAANTRDGKFQDYSVTGPYVSLTIHS